jgi:hypothetical protein
MTNLQDQKYSAINTNEIDLYQIFSIIWGKKIIIVFITFLFGVASIFGALNLPNVYKSQVLLMPKESQSGMGGVLDSYSGMAGLAGISLPSGDSGSKSKEAISRIKSFEFFSNNFLPNIALEDLLAAKEWNPVTNKLAYDEDVFNNKSGKWLREVSFPKSVKPSPQEAFITFNEIMNISEDPKTSFISLSIKHISPLIAKQWVELIIIEIDQEMRKIDKNKASRSIEYLNSVYATASYGEIKKSLSSLQQEQIKQLMMIEADKNYVFKVLDSPIAPELKSEPKRASIVILVTLFGFLCSIFFTLTYSYLRK